MAKYNVWINNAPRDRAGHVYPQGLAREKGGKPFEFDTIEEAETWLRLNHYENTTDATVRRSGYPCEALTTRKVQCPDRKTPGGCVSDADATDTCRYCGRDLSEE